MSAVAENRGQDTQRRPKNRTTEKSTRKRAARFGMKATGRPRRVKKANLLVGPDM
jgi:hypothetical protein